jgi:hypothetical protein
MKRNLYEEIREGFEYLKNNRSKPKTVSPKKNVDTKISESVKDRKKADV